MSNSALILVRSTPGDGHDALIDAVLSHWPQRERPSLRQLTIDEALADEAAFERARCIWFLVDDIANFAVQELLLRAQDQFCAVMMTCGGETQPIGAKLASGVVGAPADAPAIALCAVARTLWNQSDVVRALRAEIELLHAHSGGLATQFDKLDEELRLAAQLQRDFLPTALPGINGVDFRVIFRPASYVSGDIYDVIRFDDRHIGFFIADAVGHGVPAALMTVYIKRSLRTGKRADDAGREMRIIPPNEALQHLNRDMIRQQHGTVRFATACYGIIDTHTNVLTFARAGHPYPLLLRADGTKEWLDAEGGLLGVFPDEDFPSSQTQLHPGDRLLLYSDGFELAFGEQIQKNGQRRRVANRAYTEEFEALSQGTIDDAFNHLSMRLDEQAGSLNQIDDLTAVLIQIQPPPHLAELKGDETRLAMAV